MTLSTPVRLSAAALLLALAACKPAPPAEPAATAATAPAPAGREAHEGHADHEITSPTDAAADVRVGSLVISNPTSRETPLAGGTGPGFLRIRNDGRSDDRLIAASSPAVDLVEIHEMSMDGGQMQMRALTDGLPIAAGSTVELAPGGLHLMLIGVKAPLAAGETVPLELRFEQAGTVTVNLAVQARTVAH